MIGILDLDNVGEGWMELRDEKLKNGKATRWRKRVELYVCPVGRDVFQQTARCNMGQADP